MSGKNNRGPWLKDPRKPRAGETIGGGHFVFRRGDGSGRIRPSTWPFEYASAEEARGQADILAREYPGYRFDVVSVVASSLVPPGVAEAAE